MKTKILLLLIFICQLSFGQETKSIKIKKDRPIKLKNTVSKHVRLLSYSNPKEEPESVVNTHNPNSFYHHKKSNSSSYTTIEDEAFDKLYANGSNLKSHATAKSRNESLEEEIVVESEYPAMKPPRHGKNSIYHHRRSASKGCIVIEDAEYERLYEKSVDRKHKKKPSARLQYKTESKKTKY